MSLAGEIGLDREFESIRHECILSILRTATMIDKKAYTFFSDYPVTDAQFNILELIYYSEKKSLSQIEIGKRLLVNRANVTGLIDRLEKAGYVRRTADPDDRRKNVIVNTEQAVALIMKLEEKYMKEINKATADLSDEDLENVLNNLEKIRKRLA